MPLKYKLDSLDGLDDAVKGLYEAEGDKFVLKLEGLEQGDGAGLRRKNEELLTEVKELKKQITAKDKKEKDAEAAARKAAEEAAAKNGDIEAIRSHAAKQLAEAIAEVEGKYKPLVDKLNTNVRRLLIDNVATVSAAKIGLKGHEQILVPFISKRLDVEEQANGEYRTVVRDAQGQATAMTIDDLEKEFAGSTAFAPIIAGSKANGSGAGGGGGGTTTKPGGGASGAKQVTRSEWDTMAPNAQFDHIRAGGTIVDNP